MKKYDVFISYRREGGYETAKHLNDLLVNDGYRVSFDIDTLRNGDFDIQLLDRIEQCEDFILIVDQHAFDKTLDPSVEPKDDWLRCELAYALKHKKNIVPVFLSGVSTFPTGLPEDIIEVIKKNGPEYNKYYFDDFYQTLTSRFLISRSIKKKIAIGLLFFILILGLTFSLIKYNISKEVIYIDPLVPHSTNKSDIDVYAQTRLDLIADSLKLTNQIFMIDYLLDKKDSESELSKGLCYIVGYGCKKDYKKAVKYISKAANNEVAIAQYLMGACYDNGIGIKQDLERAMYWYKKAAEQGVLEAQCDYAIGCTTKNNMTEAYEWLLHAAEEGYAKAQYTLAWCYGNNLINDDAIYWMKEAADQDYNMAKLALCNLYLNGPPNIQQFDTAVKILKNLSQENSALAPLAQYNLACCYSQKKGVEMDFNKAMEYLNNSADSGFAQALVDLGNVYCSGLTLTDSIIPQDFNKAMKLYKEAAKQGYPMAYIQIGRMYENAWGVKKNNKKSKEWYKKAEKQGLTLQLIQQYMQQQQRQNLQNNDI